MALDTNALPPFEHPDAPSVDAVLRTLGVGRNTVPHPPDAHDEDEDDVDEILGELVAMVLSQSTTATLSAQSFGALLDRFGGEWGRIAHAPVDDVIDAIRVGGLARQKAPRIQGILTRTHARFGAYDLDALRTMPLADARRFLLSLPGVGPHTASFVLMRAAKRPVFAMDNGILRVAARLGWTSAGGTSRRAHATMQPHIPDGAHDAAHVALIELARGTCTKRDPACAACPLRELCPSADV